MIMVKSLKNLPLKNMLNKMKLDKAVTKPDKVVTKPDKVVAKSNKVVAKPDKVVAKSNKVIAKPDKVVAKPVTKPDKVDKVLKLFIVVPLSFLCFSFPSISCYIIITFSCSFA